MSVRLKVVLGFGVLAALAAALGLAAFNTNARVERVWQNAAEGAIAINNKAAEFEYCRLMTRRYEKDFLLFYKTEGFTRTRDRYIKKLLYSQLQRMKAICDEINLLMLKNPQQEYFPTDKIIKLIGSYRAAVDEGVKSIEALEAQPSGEAGQIYTIILTNPKVQGMRSAAGALEAESRKMADSASRNADKAIVYANNIAHDSLGLIFWIALFVLLIAIIFAVLMIWAISRSFNKLSLSAKEAIQGELADSLKGVLIKMRQAITQITLASNSMHTVSSREISLASEQSRAIRTAHDTAIKILENITRIAGDLKKAADEAGGAGNRMQELRSQVHTGSGKINSLNDSLHKIAKVAESIAATAEQANIIAMNASLEASRAAQNQGSEFNPMMDSIRKLSDGTVKSTKDIARLIESISKEASQAAGILIEAEQHLDSEISRAQGSIAESRDIAMRCAQEGTGAKLVADAMSTLAHVIDMIISAAKEIEDSSIQLTKVYADLQASADKVKTV